KAAELDHAQREAHHLRKVYNDLKSKSTKCRKDLQQLKDEVKDLELEARQPNREDSPLTRKIRMLENRLDKAMIKYNEAQSIRKTYEQIVKRLKEERVSFDNQLGALERSLQTKSKDHDELLLLSGDANHAREVAQQELDRVRSGYEEERRRRETELRERHQVLQMRKQMKERTERRAKMKEDIVAQEMGERGEQGLQKAAAVNSVTTARMAIDRVNQKSKIDVFENAFRKIKEARRTKSRGPADACHHLLWVSDVNEVIQKIVSQESTAENLMRLTKENQAAIEGLNREKAALKARVEEVKYSGPGEGHRRKMVDDHQELLSNSLARLERVKHKYERLAKGLISAKAGIEHLQDKLKSTATEVGVESIVMTDETVVDVLEVSENVLREVSERIKVHNFDRGRSFAKNASEDSPEPAQSPPRAIVPTSGASVAGTGAESEANAAAEEEILQARPFNQRIELPMGAGD
ncbi:unnamed protein product, partial [Discosporangium mesarthrocarpum]